MSDSRVNQTSGVAFNGTAGIADRQVARAWALIQINSPVILATIGVNFRWKDRQGTVRTKSVLSVPLLNAGNFSSSEVLYFFDTGSNSGVNFEYEVVTGAIPGTFDYDVAVGLEDMFIGS